MANHLWSRRSRETWVRNPPKPPSGPVIRWITHRTQSKGHKAKSMKEKGVWGQVQAPESLISVESQRRGIIATEHWVAATQSKMLFAKGVSNGSVPWVFVDALSCVHRFWLQKETSAQHKQQALCSYSKVSHSDQCYGLYGCSQSPGCLLPVLGSPVM